MSTATQTLTYEQFERLYGQSDTKYEYWFGEAIPKGTPTWVHGFSQFLIMRLLADVGYFPSSEVELRIDPHARPKPDVIALRSKPAQPYPTSGVDVVIEIVSEDDTYQRLREKCRKYQEWGCGRIYVVDPFDRSVVQWRDGGFTPVDGIVGIPVLKIWTALDQQS